MLSREVRQNGDREDREGRARAELAQEQHGRRRQ